MDTELKNLFQSSQNLMGIDGLIFEKVKELVGLERKYKILNRIIKDL